MSAANGVFQALGTGLFHVGVEVYGWEWSYGFTSNGTGVFASRPATCKARSYRQPISMGRTKLSLEEVQILLQGLQREWLGWHYNLLRRNCVHFCEALCRGLVVGPPPRWIASLSAAGERLQDALDGLGKAGTLLEAAAEVAAARSGVRPHVRL
mmetsp:Transcript_35998/g.102802  ORF Transcript_35998/g.102802 Transcript_35998/m.102802 type:complete len:154 (-) Transcript_35998:42-503(-)